MTEIVKAIMTACFAYIGYAAGGILLTLMLAAFLKRWRNEQNSLFSSLLLGLGIEASFHVQPPILLVFLGYFAFEIGWSKISRNFAMSGMLVLGVLLALCRGPDGYFHKGYKIFTGEI